MLVRAATGGGKSTLLANMSKIDMEHGYGLVLIENKGDLFHMVTNYVPPNRVNDVIIMDVMADTRFPVGFNVLDQGDPRVVIDELAELFEYLDGGSLGIWTREVLYHGLRTITAVPGLTIVDLATLLVPRTTEELTWADNVGRSVKDPEIRQFWQRYDNLPRAEKDRFVKPVMDRLWQLTARPEIRNIVGQSKSSFQMSDVIAQNKILLINLQNLPRSTSSLVGTLAMNALWHAVTTTPSTTSTFLYLDEFQSFLKIPVSTEEMLAKSRSFGLGMVLAHQHGDQLPREMDQAIMANARTKIVMQSNASDAHAMAREFGGSVDERDFMNLQQYEAIARVATGSGVSQPLTMVLNPPAVGYDSANQVKHLSRRAYGRKIREVEEEMIKRRQPEQAPPSKRPKISGWDS